VTLPPETRFTVLVSDAERIDSFLADQLQISRTVAARIIAEKCVSVGGKPVRASLKPEKGMEFTIVIAGEPPRQVKPADIPLNIVFEDDVMAVVDKPAGLVVHPAPGHWDDTLVNALAARGLNLAGGDEGRPGIVHRLDKDTSGLLVVAKTGKAHEKLGTALQDRRVSRRYAALAWGHIGPDERVINASMERNPSDRKRMRVVELPGSGRQWMGGGAVRAQGKSAVTTVRTIARGGTADLVQCALQTGRTHQIRVHLQSIGHPVVGDATYGGTSVGRSDHSRMAAEMLVKVTPRQALHAAWLVLPHPTTGQPIDLRSEWPEDLRPALRAAIDDPALLAETKPLQYLGFFASGESA
jgi:23S rRNA pseudouridine1911/1915/1917 synthase